MTQECLNRWDFRTEEHDIRFGITCTDREGKVTPAVRHRRIAAHQMDETGVLACEAPATCTVKTSFLHTNFNFVLFQIQSRSITLTVCSELKRFIILFTSRSP